MWFLENLKLHWWLAISVSVSTEGYKGKRHAFLIPCSLAHSSYSWEVTIVSSCWIFLEGFCVHTNICVSACYLLFLLFYINVIIVLFYNLYHITLNICLLVHIVLQHFKQYLPSIVFMDITYLTHTRLTGICVVSLVIC